MTCPVEVRKWLEIFLPLCLLGGAGGLGLELQSFERYIENDTYVDQVSVEFLEFELRHNAEIAALAERIARLEGSHEK